MYSPYENQYPPTTYNPVPPHLQPYNTLSAQIVTSTSGYPTTTNEQYHPSHFPTNQNDRTTNEYLIQAMEHASLADSTANEGNESFDTERRLSNWEEALKQYVMATEFYFEGLKGIFVGESNSNLL
jgi:hypothetical protein